MSLDRAIEQLQTEVTSYGHGTPTQPKPESAEWFLLRAKTLGLSALRRMKQLGVAGDPAAAERYYRRSSNEVKAVAPGSAEEVIVGPS